MSDNIIEKFNSDMIKTVKENGFLSNHDYEKAFLKVKRHLFVPQLWVNENSKWQELKCDRTKPDKDLLARIYVDTPLAVLVRNNEVLTTNSQPTVMAMMIEEAMIDKGDNILEIGTGSGYNAAVLSEVAGSQMKVVTLEILKEIQEMSKQNLEFAGYQNISSLCSDGFYGHSDRSPYNKIVVTCACLDIPQLWVNQLVQGGTIVTPLAVKGLETIVSLKKVKKNTLEGRPSYFVRFFTFRGPFTVGTRIYQTYNKAKDISTKHGKETKIFDESVEKLTRKEKTSFIFFLTVSTKEAFFFGDYDSDPPASFYGLWHKTGETQGIVLVYPDKMYTFGSESLIGQLKGIYHKWFDYGKPEPKDYRMKVYPKNNFVKTTKKDFVVDTNSFKIVYSLR